MRIPGEVILFMLSKIVLLLAFPEAMKIH